MKTIYEVYNNQTVIPFLTGQEAIDYIQGTNLGFQIRSVEIQEENSNSNEIQLYKDLAFGEKLINEFLLDNRILPQTFTPQDNFNLLNKFSVIKDLAYVGDIRTVKVLVEMSEIDSIYTQERKDKYLRMINTYLQ